MAQYLLELGRALAEGEEELLVSMFYPPGSHPDDNPLFILCRNDPCSFTWTGEDHIHQVRRERERESTCMRGRVHSVQYLQM